MSIAVTTPTGHIGSRVARLLVQAGVRPTLLLRDPNKLDSELRAESETRIIDQDDAASVVEATKGVDTLFWLNAPAHSDDPIAGYVRKGENAARAVRENGIRRVVFLSSIGAEKRHGAGVVDGLGQTEDLLNATDAAVVHLRPGFFFTNFFMQLEGLKQGFFSFPASPEVAMPYVDPRDIGDVAAARLLDPNWTGHHTQGVHGPKDLTFTEAAAILSEATGRPIAYQEAPDDAFRDGLQKAGLPPKVIDGYLQMYALLRADYTLPDPRSVLTTTPTSLGAWAHDNLRPALR